MKKTKVINLFGGPGSGKSTLAADLFSELKKHDFETEMVREWVKQWAWEGREMNYADQVIVFGHQVQEETALYGKVDILVTDSPLILSGFYENENHNLDFLVHSAKKIMLEAECSGIEYWNLLIKRNWPYQAKGRFQTEEQAQVLEKRMIKFLKRHNLPFETVTSVEDIMLEIWQ